MQSEIIANSFVKKAADLEVPFYTFSETLALGAGLMLLSSGNRVHANPHSLLGGVSSAVNSLGLVKALSMLKVKYTSISTAESRLNPFENIKEEDQKWINGILKHQDEAMKNYIARFRKQIIVEAI